MRQQQLSTAAEGLRQQIKTMVMEAAPKPPDDSDNKETVFKKTVPRETVFEDANGYKVYDGIDLNKKVFELIKLMYLGEEVCF